MELVYLLSVFEKEGWEKWKDSLVLMLGSKRTIEVYGNQDLYSWVINHFAETVEGYRKKDLNLIKAICRLPQCNAEGKNPVKKWMMEEGYSEDEICFLNLSVLPGVTLPKRLIYPSITLEKMALHACSRFLGSEKEYPQEVYSLCAELLKRYETYEIKLEGDKGIFASLQKRDFFVRSVNTYLTLLPYHGRSYVPDSYFAIDLLDTKWDVLQKKLSPGTYTENIVKTLVEKEYSSEELAKCVKRYEEITGEELSRYFWTADRYPNGILFAKMAKHKLVDASGLAMQYVEDYQKLPNKEWMKKWEYMLDNMYSFVFTLENEVSYGVFERLVAEVGVGEINPVLQKFDAVEKILGLDTYQWSPGKLHITRKCFDPAQNKKIFQWAEQYVYLKYPDRYQDFLYAVLVSETESGVMEKESAEAAARYILKHGSNLGYRAQELREKYWTKTELEEYKKKLEKEK
ncbi:MAG: hypothetical protein ACLSFZ_00640 [Frisingicoccus sp.]